MSNKTVVVVLTVAALLLGFIFFFERDTLTTSERMERKGRVFADFKKEAVTKVEITRKGQKKIVIEKETEAVPDPTEADASWRITAPKVLRADDSAVRQILSAIDYLLVDRTIQGRDKQKEPSFGLTEPRIEAAYTLHGKTVSFSIGGEARGDKVYLAASSAPDSIFAVSNEILTSLDKGLNDLRDKKLLETRVTEAEEVAIERSGDPIELKRQDERWQIKVGDTWILAAADQVRELTNLVQDLEADEFIEDDVNKESLSKYGLDAPAMSVELKLPGEKRAAVSVGKACPGEEARRYVKVFGSETVVCVNDDFVKVLERPLIRFQETRPAVFSASDVDAVKLSSKGETLELEMKDEAWQLKSGDTALENKAVEKLLKALTETRASKIDAGEGAVAPLGEAAGEVVLSLTDEMGEVSLQWFEGDEETAKIRRKDEPAVLTVPRRLVDRLAPNLLAFRAKTLKNGDLLDAKRMRIKGPASQTLEKKAGEWVLVEPFETGADDVAARRAAELIAEVKVDSFVAGKAAPEHGLTPPWAEVTVRFDSIDTDQEGDSEKAKTTKKEVVLEIGAEAEGGKRYARLKGKDPVVFLVGDEYETALLRPLIARDLPQIDDEKITALSLAAGAKTVQLVKEGDDWSSADRTPIDRDTAKRIVANLGGMKSISTVAFGKKDETFGEIRLTVRAWAEKKDDAPPQKTLTVGTKSPDTTEDGYLARVEGVDATLVIPARIVDEIIAFVNPGAEAQE